MYESRVDLCSSNHLHVFSSLHFICLFELIQFLSLSDLCKQMRPLYPQANVMRTPDMSVETSGIAGGQRSILDKELRDVNQGHLIPLVDIEVAKVRAEGGKVCQVTPVADT
jgi:pyruvate/oxaloacetate carboxyltransferase